MLSVSALAPIAVLELPLRFRKRVLKPIAVFLSPVARLKRAPCPSAVLPFGYPPSGSGLTPNAFGATGHKSASVIRSDGVVVLSQIIDFIVHLLSPPRFGFDDSGV